ncbi:MAG: hypothetical protein IKZ53_08810 [Selenomonadaceae bacterium]|nr:hypothetical protein [Selenomonadaceae bacterium]
MKKVFMAAAIFMMTLIFAAQNACAQEVEVYTDSETRTTYCVDDSTITYTNFDIAFKVKVVSYEKTYSPQEQWYFFEEEEDGTVAYVVGEGGFAHTVKRADEPAYSIFKFCLKHLHIHHDQPMAGA